MEKHIEAKGMNGQLHVYDNKVVISRKGFVGFVQHNAKGCKDIYIKNITGIQFKKASSLMRGYIQIVFSGSSESKGSTSDLIKDENAIIFKKRDNAEFEKAKQTIETIMDSVNNPKKELQSSDNHSLNDLERLSELKDKGIITEDEFLAKKKQILGI